MLLLLLILTKWINSQVVNVSLGEEYFIEYDMPTNKNTAWYIGDPAIFTLPLFNGSVIEVTGEVTFVKKFKDLYNLRNIFIHGNVPAIENISLAPGTFSASFYDDTMSANIQYSGHIQYELRPSNIAMSTPGFTKTYRMSKVNMAEKYYSKDEDEMYAMRNSFQPNLRTQSVSVFKESSNKATITKTTYNMKSQGTAQLKVLVLYTKQAVQTAGSEASLLSQISLAIGNFNVALQNSQVDMTVSYVAERIQEYDTYVENAELGVMLGQMGSTISTARRNVLGCHAVHLTTSNTQYCGIGNYAYNGLTGGYSASFCGCIGGYMSLAHEVGHNIGLHHDLSAYGGAGINHGWCWDDASGVSNCHRSVMAYAGCVTPNGKSNCDRVKYFSSPSVSEMSNPVGTATVGNDAQQLRNNIFGFMNQFTPSFASTSTLAPITFNPSILPSIQPSCKPSIQLSVKSTQFPTLVPYYFLTDKPSQQPTVNPNMNPSISPSTSPIVSTPYNPSTTSTFKPTLTQTYFPTLIPTTAPTFVPTLKPSYNPAALPTFVPSFRQTYFPTLIPTTAPTFVPTLKPSFNPTALPTFVPSFRQTYFPSVTPSETPSVALTNAPTHGPTESTAKPTLSPTSKNNILAVDTNKTFASFSLQNIYIVSSIAFLMLCLLCAFCIRRNKVKEDAESKVDVLDFKRMSGVSASNGIGYSFKDVYAKMSSKKDGNRYDIKTPSPHAAASFVNRTDELRNDEEDFETFYADNEQDEYDAEDCQQSDEDERALNSLKEQRMPTESSIKLSTEVYNIPSQTNRMTNGFGISAKLFSSQK